MTQQTLFSTLRRVMVPILDGVETEAALAAAQALAPETLLVGIVRLGAGEPRSAGASRAQQLRRRLREYDRRAGVRVRDTVLVAEKAWVELQAVIAAEAPDLLMLEWDAHLKGLNVTLKDVFAQPSCDLALVRGRIRPSLKHVLVPMRGGPYAELALRVGLSLKPRRLTALHIQLSGGGGSDAPFKGLDRVLERMRDVRRRSITTRDAARTIQDESEKADLVILGASARPAHTSSALGPVADRLLKQSPSAVMIVKTQRPMPETVTDESIGSGAISILVDKWFAENTFHATEFARLDRMVSLKREQGVTVSLALPALNEAQTVGKVIRTIKRALMEKYPLLDEIVLIDSNSTDRTREIAAGLGVPVHIHQELLPRLGARKGKGEALWKSLLVTKGDIVLWIDTDIVNIHPRFVYGILGPLLLKPQIQFVKGFYRRPLRVGDKIQAGSGGRVTELTARPLLNLFYPELSGVVQPLSGEYGGRRGALEQCAFFSGYGVEIGLLIDICERYGIDAIAQVDLLERIHHNQSLEALGKMSFAIIQAVMRKLERHYERDFIADVNKTMKMVRYESSGYFLDVQEIAERERPPMRGLPEYRHRAGGGRRR